MPLSVGPSRGKVADSTPSREGDAMSENLGPIEVLCDAPPYPVVKSCANLGFVRPQDVRWSRLDRRSLRRPAGLFWLRPAAARCTCGEALPAMEGYVFTFVSGSQARYHLCQCKRCRAIYWDKERHVTRVASQSACPPRRPLARASPCCWRPSWSPPRSWPCPTTTSRDPASGWPAT